MLSRASVVVRKLPRHARLELLERALRRAKLEILREKKDPYYWGAFTLSGEWR